MSYSLITASLYLDTRTVATILSHYWYQLVIFHKFYARMQKDIDKAMSHFIKCEIERKQTSEGYRSNYTIYKHHFDKFDIPDEIFDYKEPGREGQEWIHTFDDYLMINNQPTIRYSLSL